MKPQEEIPIHLPAYRIMIEGFLYKSFSASTPHPHFPLHNFSLYNASSRCHTILIIRGNRTSMFETDEWIITHEVKMKCLAVPEEFSILYLLSTLSFTKENSSL